MVELSPPYFAASSSKVLEVQLRAEPLLRLKSSRRLPPTIPTLTRPCKASKKVAKTYFVGIIPSPSRAKNKGSTGETLQSPELDEQSVIEKRIAYRAGRANRFLFGRAFPALRDEAILPRWHGETEAGPSLGRPTLSSLRRKRTVDFDRSREDEGQKALAPWRPADHCRKMDHPGNVALSRVQPQSPETKSMPVTRRKTVTLQELETIETRAAGKKRAEKLLHRLRSSNRRNSVQPIPLSDFQERIRKAGEARRAKWRPTAIEDGTESAHSISPSSPRCLFGGSSSSLDLSPTSPANSQGSRKIL